MMNNIFIKYHKFVLVFIDDILLYSKSKEEHEEDLRIILRVLREHQIYANFSEFVFYKPQIQYLCHIISEKGLVVDPKNIESIDEWTTPTCVTYIRSFLGLAGYYRKFIENFSRISYAMTAIQKKENKFLWTTKCEESFQKIKQIFSTAPILRIADPGGYFIVCTNVRK